MNRERLRALWLGKAGTSLRWGVGGAILLVLGITQGGQTPADDTCGTGWSIAVMGLGVGIAVFEVTRNLYAKRITRAVAAERDRCARIAFGIGSQPIAAGIMTGDDAVRVIGDHHRTRADKS